MRSILSNNSPTPNVAQTIKILEDDFSYFGNWETDHLLRNGTENVTCRRKVNERKKENKNSKFGVVPPKRIHYSGCKNSYAEDPTD